MSRSPEDWRRRLSGRIPFDRGAAQRAIRRAYRAGGIAEPEQILWARGPGEAAEILRFLGQPPRRQRTLGVALLAGGAVLWPVLALATVDPRAGEQPTSAVTLIAAVAAFYLVRLSARSLPAPPPAGGTMSRGGAIWAAMIVYVLMMTAQIAVQRLGLPADAVARNTALIVTAVAGALPGAMLLLRVRRSYRDLPDALHDLAPGRSVVRALNHGRKLAFARLGRPAGPARPDETLLRAYRSAYAEAFTRSEPLFPDGGGLAPARRGGLIGEPAWTAGPIRRGDLAPLRPMPDHLDGIESAEAASAAERDGTAASAAFGELAFRVDRLFPFRSVALAVLPPRLVSLDADGRPHAEHGPALSWADGTEVHSWRGRVVEADLIDGRAPLTVWRILSEREPDRQAVLIERYGLGRFLTENAAARVQSDACGTLYRLEQPREPIVAVRVVNNTPEPDGSFQEFWLRVPATMRTAREAVAWTFALSADEYDPAAQT